MTYKYATSLLDKYSASRPTNNVFEVISRRMLVKDLLSQSTGKLKYMLKLSICFLL